MTAQQAERANGHAQLAPRVPAATRVGQGTAVEQSRAVAEVEATIVVALRHPRDIEKAIAEMQRSCARASLAEKAFFRFSRGEGQITGPSVQLARELARCWGNFQSGLVEMRRDDDYRQSEMQAWAWDVQTNTRTSTTFIVPHIRDTKKGPRDLTDMRDIYENNANMGARRLREMIFDTLPGWFTEDAVQACYATLAGDYDDLPQRRDKCVAGFGMLGITEKQLAQKLGSPARNWSPGDLATLTVIYRSLQRGEIRKEEEFGDAGLTAADVLGPAAPAEAAPAPPAQPAPEPPAETAPAVPAQEEIQAEAPAPEPPAAEPDAKRVPGSATKEQVGALWKLASGKFGFTPDDKAQWRMACERVIRRKLTGGTTSNLSCEEAVLLGHEFGNLSDRAQLTAYLAELAGGTQ